MKTICTFPELIVAVDKSFMEKQLEYIFEELLNQPYRDYVLKKYKITTSILFTLFRHKPLKATLDGANTYL